MQQHSIIAHNRATAATLYNHTYRLQESNVSQLHIDVAPAIERGCDTRPGFALGEIWSCVFSLLKGQYFYPIIMFSDIHVCRSVEIHRTSFLLWTFSQFWFRYVGPTSCNWPLCSKCDTILSKIKRKQNTIHITKAKQPRKKCCYALKFVWKISWWMPSIMTVGRPAHYVEVNLLAPSPRVHGVKVKCVDCLWLVGPIKRGKFHHHLLIKQWNL